MLIAIADRVSEIVDSHADAIHERGSVGSVRHRLLPYPCVGLGEEKRCGRKRLTGRGIAL